MDRDHFWDYHFTLEFLNFKMKPINITKKNREAQHVSFLHRVASSAHSNVHLKVDAGLAVFILTSTLCYDTMPYSLGSDSLAA